MTQTIRDAQHAEYLSNLANLSAIATYVSLLIGVFAIIYRLDLGALLSCGALIAFGVFACLPARIISRSKEAHQHRIALHQASERLDSLISNDPHYRTYQHYDAISTLQTSLTQHICQFSSYAHILNLLKPNEDNNVDCLINRTTDEITNALRWAEQNPRENPQHVLLQQHLNPNQLASVTCLITGETMIDPVSPPGQRYHFDRYAIQHYWNRGERLCPINRSLVLTNPMTWPTDKEKKNEIEALIQGLPVTPDSDNKHHRHK